MLDGTRDTGGRKIGDRGGKIVEYFGGSVYRMILSDLVNVTGEQWSLRHIFITSCSRSYIIISKESSYWLGRLGAGQSGAVFLCCCCRGPQLR